MDVYIDNGGARDNDTVYQIIVDSSNLQMSVRSIINSTWATFDMRQLFAHAINNM
jgi:hypothetical protein